MPQRQASPWFNRRVQRCLGFAGILLICLAFALYYSAYRSPIQGFNLNTLASITTSTHKSDQITITTTLDRTRIALLFETRPLPHLPALLTHFISVLPAPWTFHFIGSLSSLQLISSSNILSSHIHSGKLILTSSPEEYPVGNQEEVSQTFTNLSFYRDFLAPAEWVLIFQSDSMVCAASERNLDDWVDKGYTYLGAPWDISNRWGGNGGLSLRHIPPIVILLEKEQRVKGDSWEDRWLSDRLGVMAGTNMPGAEIERYFSVESLWTEWPFGYHLGGSGKGLVKGIWGNETRRRAVLEYCPEIKIALDLVAVV